MKRPYDGNGFTSRLFETLQQMHEKEENLTEDVINRKNEMNTKLDKKLDNGAWKEASDDFDAAVGAEKHAGADEHAGAEKHAGADEHAESEESEEERKTNKFLVAGDALFGKKRGK